MKWHIIPFALLAVAFCVPVAADDKNTHINYMLHCQGCHTPDGSGVPNKVPALKGFMGNFLRVEGGREFLIRVPGAAQSALSDIELAELTNWMLHNFSPSEVPENFQPYSGKEVAALRVNALIDVASVRAELLIKMVAMGGLDGPTSRPPTPAL